jgi:arginyl-tRNA synthetase
MDKGFINLVIEEDWLAKRIHELVTNKESIRSYSLTDKPLNVLIDFASPNMCKELHVGHLRSTILGNCLSNLLEFVGHKVERISHVGDFGTPLGMVIAQAIDSKAAFVADPSSLPSPSYLSGQQSVYILSIHMNISTLFSNVLTS